MNLPTALIAIILLLTLSVGSGLWIMITHGEEMSKYDYMARKCFGMDYCHLDNEQQIVVQDLYSEREN